MTECKLTIDEAIKDLELIVMYPKTPIGSHTRMAIQMGIEALKREKENLRRDRKGDRL